MPIKFLKSVFVFSNIQQNKAMQVTDDKHCTYSSTHCLLLTGNGLSHCCKIQISEQSITYIYYLS